MSQICWEIAAIGRNSVAFGKSETIDFMIEFRKRQSRSGFILSPGLSPGDRSLCG
jgi:hypothetical protein